MRVFVFLRACMCLCVYANVCACIYVCDRVFTFVDVCVCVAAMGKFGHEGDGGCECAGLTVRGSFYIVVDKVSDAHSTRRQLIEQLNFPPVYAFAKTDGHDIEQKTFSALSAELPANVKLMTVTNNYASVHNGQVLLRLAHMYELNEHDTLSAPATVDFTTVFAKAGLKVTAAVETTLTANQDREGADARRKAWPTVDVTGGKVCCICMHYVGVVSGQHVNNQCGVQVSRSCIPLKCSACNLPL